ncbi:hypothetical protein BDV12DRAFT_204793 [Aspergillus spectabilis]
MSRVLGIFPTIRAPETACLHSYVKQHQVYSDWGRRIDPGFQIPMINPIRASSVALGTSGAMHYAGIGKHARNDSLPATKSHDVVYSASVNKSVTRTRLTGERAPLVSHALKQDLDGDDPPLPAEQPRFDFLANFTKTTGLNEAYNYKSHLTGEIWPGGTNDVGRFQGTTTSNPFDCYTSELESALGGGANTIQSQTMDPTPGADQDALMIEKAKYL